MFKMKMPVFIMLLILTYEGKSQELYVFSEPASTRPAKSVAFNITGRYPDSKYYKYFSHRYIPQVIVGVNKNLTVNVGAAASNYYSRDKLRFDGARMYIKYRFLSNDGLHKHFRMAAFAEGGFSRNEYLYDEMGLDGDNDGVLAGLIATQLIKKFAFSATTSYLTVFTKNDPEHHTVLNHSTQMMSYSLSAGYLLLPKEYVDYKQMNLNLYLELLGSKSLDKRFYMVDIAPAIQFIFHSNTKINLGYRLQLRSNMSRVGERTLEVGIERTILNFWK